MSEEVVADRSDESTTGAADEGDLSRLLSSATLVLLGQVLFSASTLVERAVVANALSLDAYGRVGIGLSVLTLGTTLGMLGFEPGVSRYVSRVSDEADRRGVFLTGVAVALVGSSLVAGTLYLNLDLLAGLLLDPGTDPELLGLFVAAIPLVAMLKIAVAGIRGMENTIYRTYAEHLVYPGLRLGLLVGFLGLGWELAAAGYAYLVAAAVAGLVAFALLDRLFRIRGTFRTHFREMFSYSAPLVLSGVAAMLLSKSDTLMVGFFGTTEQVAYYEAAYPLATGLSLFLGAFGFMYFPLISRLDSEDRLDEVAETYELTTKWVYLLTFPVFLLFVTFSDDTLRIVLRPEYETAGLALSILSVGYFSQAAAGRCLETLSAFGRTRALFALNTSAFVFNLGLNLVLIPAYGFVGAAVASAVAYVALNAAAVTLLRRWFGLTPFSSASVRTFVVLPAVLLPPFFLLARSVRLSVWTFLLLVVVLPLLSVGVYLAAGCAEPQDRAAVDLVEAKLGRSLPLVDRVVPPREE